MSQCGSLCCTCMGVGSSGTGECWQSPGLPGCEHACCSACVEACRPCRGAEGEGSGLARLEPVCACPALFVCQALRLRLYVSAAPSYSLLLLSIFCALIPGLQTKWMPGRPACMHAAPSYMLCTSCKLHGVLWQRSTVNRQRRCCIAPSSLATIKPWKVACRQHSLAAFILTVKTLFSCMLIGISPWRFIWWTARLKPNHCSFNVFLHAGTQISISCTTPGWRT